MSLMCLIPIESSLRRLPKCLCGAAFDDFQDPIIKFARNLVNIYTVVCFELLGKGIYSWVGGEK
jgi:hypothetical protein